MVDYCTQSATEEDFNTMALDCGLCVEQEDEEGNITVVPASYLVLIDRIGPITMGDITYPEYHVNLRGTFTDEQITALEPMCVYPPVPYRVWA